MYVHYSAPIGERSIVVSVSVCLSLCVCFCVCACPRSYLQNYTSDLHEIFERVIYVGGLVVLWRRSDMLRTSGFMDDKGAE